MAAGIRVTLLQLVFVCLSTLPSAAQSSRIDQLRLYFDQGEAALKANNYPDAELAYEHLSKLDPSAAEVHAKLGVIYYEEGKFIDAIAALRRAVAIKPALSDSRTLLSISLAELGRNQEALPGLEKGFRTSSSPPLKRLAGLHLERAYTAELQHEKAVQISLELARLYPDDPEVLYYAGKILGNFAYLAMMRLSNAPASSIWRHQAAGEAAESQGDLGRALGEYQTVLDLNPLRPGVHYRMGRVLLQTAQKPDAPPEALATAARHFEAELQRDPTNANAAYELGEIHRRALDFASARQYFAQAVEADAGFEEAQLGLGRTLMAVNKPELALPHLRAALALAPQRALTYYHLAKVHAALGNTAEQSKALQEYNRLRLGQMEQEAKEVLYSREVTRQEPDSEPAQ